MCCPKTHPSWHYYPATLLLQCCREVAFQPPVGVTVQSSMRNAHGRTNATCGRLVSHQSAATDTQTSYYGHSLPRGSPFIAPRQPFTIQPLQESFHARSPKSSKQHIISASRSVPILFTASSRKQTIQHIFLFIQNQNCSSHMQGNFQCNLYSGDQTSTFKADFAATASKMQLCFFFLCDFFHCLEAGPKRVTGMAQMAGAMRIAKQVSS